uniref:NADH dehydrogenase subunit 4L n=1 Tax=Ornithodoros furcosus TaxID=2928876 RepID=UPI0022382FFC|nr:NADH dehydrogenase subunit 4L [Ornithodoros furcosus]UYB78323.1 NADH dehydrogenase subunit 4L [Ornithodoros furcosus]UYB78336.1 NADH dehydrogenase subunit 4L [Ornithodoros furcosus]
MMMVGLLIFVFGVLSMVLNRKHILILLLCLEFMYLGVLYNVFLVVNYNSLFIDMVIFMVFIVCEAGMGLSILVTSVFYHGNDSVGTMMLLKC